MRRFLSIILTAGIVVTLAGIALGGQRVVEEWVAHYSGGMARDLAIDEAGNVYITGRSIIDGSCDYGTVKYDTNGVELWAARYDGPANDIDQAFALAIDNSGNVYVTGDSYGSGVANDYHYATLKYDSNGSEVWVRRYNGPGICEDSARSIAVDVAGNVYVTGYSDSNLYTADYDYVTIKYDSSGNLLWITSYDSGTPSDFARDLAIDESNNVYVTGGGDDDYATIKYDPNGDQLWVAKYDGLASEWDEAVAIDLDDLGNVYVTGSSISSGSSWMDYNYDYTTIKYDPNGDQLWVARYNGPGDGGDYAKGLIVDDSGNVYVTGISCGDSTDYDYATIKYDANGSQLWVERYDSSGGGSDWAQDIARDKKGNIYVTGGAGDNDNYVTIKYDPNGNQLWLAQRDGASQAESLAVDDSGNVCVTGGGYNTVKYSQCTMEGDIDCDKDVDFEDFAMLGEYWMDSNCGDCGWADLDDDEDVNFHDLRKLTENWLEGKS